MEIGDKIAKNLERLVSEKGENNRSVAEAAGLGHTAVRDIILRKTKNPTYATLVKIAEVLGVSVLNIVGENLDPQPAIAVAGRVGAGARVPLFDAFAKGDGLFHVACPPQISPSGIVAVEVEGDSMAPMYQPGHILFYRRTTHEGILSEDIGLPCIIEDASGNAWVKQIRRGSEPGLFHLISLNANAESSWDQRIKWASRVILAIPGNMVERV